MAKEIQQGVTNNQIRLQKLQWTDYDERMDEIPGESKRGNHLESLQICEGSRDNASYMLLGHM